MDFLSLASGTSIGYPIKNMACGSHVSGNFNVRRITSCANKGQHAHTPPSPSVWAASRSCNPAAATDWIAIVRSACWRFSSGYTSISLISRQSKMEVGAEVIRSFERLIWFCIFSGGRPSRVRSRSNSIAMASARYCLTDGSVNTANRHGWRLCAEGAKVAVVRILWITDSDTGSGLKRRIERRVRKKWCGSIVFVEVCWLDPENDPPLSRAVGPGFVIVLNG